MERKTRLRHLATLQETRNGRWMLNILAASAAVFCPEFTRCTISLKLLRQLLKNHIKLGAGPVHVKLFELKPLSPTFALPAAD